MTQTTHIRATDRPTSWDASHLKIPKDTPHILVMKGGDGIAVRNIKVRQTDRKCCSSSFLTQCDCHLDGECGAVKNKLESKFIHLCMAIK